MNSLKRKLTAILSADVVGYSKLMTDDEEATVQTLKSYRKLIESLIDEHRGRLVDSPGDNLLAEFSSGVDALRCAWDIQKEIKSRNLDLPENRRMTFRIGINIGDVIEEEGRIYGDGVNVAARLESLAEVGGISISGTVHNYVENKVPFRFEDQGDQSVKNIDRPVQVYRVVMESETILKEKVKQEKESNWKRNLSIAFVVLILLLGGAALYVWDTYFHIPDVEHLTGQSEEFNLPEGPSIAVLPFDNMSGDKEQEYFSDGLTENIITTLSRNPKLFVIARNSSFYFKDKSVTIQEVAEKLNIEYVLEGSVQKSEDRVRINALLIDTKTGHHLWAEKYDRELKDFFSLHDEIAEKIFTALAVKLTDGERARIYSEYPISFDARLKLMKALSYFYRLNKEANFLAQKEAEQALAISPKHPEPYIRLSWIYLMDYYYFDPNSSRNALVQATKMAKSALDIDDSNPDPYLIFAHVSFAQGYHDKADRLAEQAIALNPNYYSTYYTIGFFSIFSDKPDKGIVFLKRAIRYNPIPPSPFFTYLGEGYRILGRYKKAIVALKKAIDREPDDIFSRIFMVATYSLSGQEEKARKETAEVLRIDPDFSLERIEKRLPYKNLDEKERLIEALRKAGLK